MAARRGQTGWLDKFAPRVVVCEDVRPMKQLVTGGAGFIGSNYVRWVLTNTDDEVVVFDALTYAGNLSTLRDVDDSPRYQFVKGNITDRGTLEEAMRGQDAVVHFAAESHVDRSIVGPDDFVNTNCFGTNVVMDTARQLEIGRVIHIGTDEVYGSVEVGSSKETDPLEPRSPYSAAKAGSDLIALSYHSTYGVPVSVTRCTNNFGPYQYPEKAIPLFTTNLLDGRPIPLYGDGLNQRDWLYVDDHCAGVDLVLRQGDSGEIYNIGAGNETPNRVLVDKLLDLLGVGEDMISYVEDRLGHDRRYSVDIAKISALGWRRQRSLDEALDETVAWYRDNRWWWEPLRAA
jgi:dTDP-glucose 4,6-dehydratase